LKQVILRVFDIGDDQLIGPGWMTSECYDILAVVPAGAPKEQIPLMFQALLAERFGLRFHRETKLTSAYALIVLDGGPKFTEAASEDGFDPLEETGKISLEGGRMSATTVSRGRYGLVKNTLEYPNIFFHREFVRITMKDFARAITRSSENRPVVDMTGLTGFYRLTVDIGGPKELPWDDEADLSVPAASGDPLRESLKKLGLKLERRNLPFEKFIIDHVEKTPTQN
jgi:uncharacterized protein (TIGR03435 family)